MYRRKMFSCAPGSLTELYGSQQLRELYDVQPHAGGSPVTPDGAQAKARGKRGTIFVDVPQEVPEAQAGPSPASRKRFSIF